VIEEVTPSQPWFWSFIVAEVPVSIIGIVFLEHFGLVVDARHRLFDGDRKQVASGSPAQQLAISRLMLPHDPVDHSSPELFNSSNGYVRLQQMPCVTIPVASTMTNRPSVQPRP
jgi:hypothetical protein